MGLASYLALSADVLTAAADHPGLADADRAVDLLIDALKAEKPILVCGNGGSASDAMHITGELVGRFLKERRAINCVCLSSNPAILTAWSNDYSFETVFARQVEAYGAKGGAIIGLSTSGNSTNVIKAFEVAREAGMATIGLTGEGGGRLGTLSNVLLAAPSTSTPMIQQVHICAYHYICAEIEARLFP